MELFDEVNIGNCKLSNRIIRSATFEGMCDVNGFPTSEYISFYEKLARQQIGGIITGFAYISQEGKAMQPGQAGMDSIEKASAFRKMTDKVHGNGGKVFIQLAHSGRQTRSSMSGRPVVSSSNKRSIYFREKPLKLTTEEIEKIVEEFGDAAWFAKEAGFDGVQIHAAHGYLIHQFILPSINNRKDVFGVDRNDRIGKEFLKRIIDDIRDKCGADYPILMKVSAGDDYFRGFTKEQFAHLIRFLDTLKIDAIEVSYGTMDYALSIFRGDIPYERILKYNPFYKDRSSLSKKLAAMFFFPYYRKKIKPFGPAYNLEYASLAKQYTSIPIISVGGFRSKSEMKEAVDQKGIDFISMSRPFIAEPDFVMKLKAQKQYTSKCCNCNACAIMCDSVYSTKCYKNEYHGNKRKSNRSHP